MRDGFVKVAAGTPEIRVADCRYNAEQIFTLMREADKQGVRVLALPELCLTGYTCGDLFLQDTLLKGAEEGLATVLEATKNLDMLTALGLPVKNPWDGKLYNCAAVIHKGEILGLVPKTYVPNYGEFYEGRWFTSGKDLDVLLNLCGQQVSIWDREIWACDTMPDLVVGVEICEDLWASMPPSVALAQAGATVILNLSASDEVVGKARLPPHPGHRPVRPAAVRLRLRQRRGGGVLHRPWCLTGTASSPRTAPCWPSGGLPPAWWSASSTWPAWPMSGGG